MKFFIVFIALFISACESGDRVSDAGESENLFRGYDHPHYLRLPIEGIISTIDPGLTEDMAAIEITEQLFLGLTDFNPTTYEPVPELAEEWIVSEDGKTYRFKLRKDVTWTGGEPVTAQDIVWAVQRNIRPETGSPYAYTLYILKNAEAFHKGRIADVSEIGVSAADDFTVEFTLEHAAAYFPAMAGLWVWRPLPRKVIEKYGNRWTEPEHIQTNGSYMLREWQKGRMMILKKYPNYYDAENVAISEVRYYIIPESFTGLVMYENDELDIIGGPYLRLPLTEILRIKASPVFSKEYSNEPEFSTYYYGFNTKRPPVDNPLVRKAIAAAIDRRLLIDVVTKGDEEPAATFTRPPIFGSVAPSEGVGIYFNPVQAKDWLAEAGYPEGKGFPEITLMYNASETNAAVAEAVQTFLKHYLNIRIRLEDREWPEYIEAIAQPKTPHMFRLGWTADYPDANNWLNEQFHPFRSANRIGWENAAFAEQVECAGEITDPEERKRRYKRAEQILTEEEAAIIPIYFYTAQYLEKPWIMGRYHMGVGGQHIRNIGFYHFYLTD